MNMPLSEKPVRTRSQLPRNSLMNTNHKLPAGNQTSLEENNALLKSNAALLEKIALKLGV